MATAIVAARARRGRDDGFAVEVACPRCSGRPGQRRRGPVGGESPEVAIAGAARGEESLRGPDGNLDSGRFDERRAPIDRAAKQESRRARAVGRAVGVTSGTTTVRSLVMCGQLRIPVTARPHAILTGVVMAIQLLTAVDRRWRAIRGELAGPEGQLRVLVDGQIRPGQEVRVRGGVGAAAVQAAAVNLAACVVGSGRVTVNVAACAVFAHRIAGACAGARAIRSGDSTAAPAGGASLAEPASRRWAYLGRCIRCIFVTGLLASDAACHEANDSEEDEAARPIQSA
jgi:hypothetical protein